MPSVERTRLEALAHRSVRVILANQAPSGAYLASPTFPVYRYSWFRDGAFIADAMSRAGHPTSAERFFGWCDHVITARAPIVAGLVARHRAGQPIGASEFLHARYSVDGADAAEDWWTFQLDGYGTWLWALGEHLTRWGGSVDPYASGVAVSVDYLAEFWNEPCYDWWEENVNERHTSTLAAVFGGLRSASNWRAIGPERQQVAETAAGAVRRLVAERAVRDGGLTKWLDGDALDASLIACSTPFSLFEPSDPVMIRTIAGLERDLAHGGVHRFRADTYYGGGEWLLLAALLGWHYVRMGRLDDAGRQLEWVGRQATEEGDLPEQVDGHLLHPMRRREWLDRWGPVATPLLWSHAMFLTLALELDIVRAPVGNGLAMATRLEAGR